MCVGLGVCVYSHSMGLFELADLLNLIHEISAVDVLHDKIQTVLRRDRGRPGEESLRGDDDWQEVKKKGARHRREKAFPKR